VQAKKNIESIIIIRKCGKYACYEINLHKSNIAIDEKIIGKYFYLMDIVCVCVCVHERSIGGVEFDDEINKMNV
jgi:hypothetical protein